MTNTEDTEEVKNTNRCTFSFTGVKIDVVYTDDSAITYIQAWASFFKVKITCVF